MDLHNPAKKIPLTVRKKLVVKQKKKWTKDTSSRTEPRITHGLAVYSSGRRHHAHPRGTRSLSRSTKARRGPQRRQRRAAPHAPTTPPQRKAPSLLLSLRSPFLPPFPSRTLLLHPPPPGRPGRPPTPLALMTTAPNIEMIASSLRHCSLSGGGSGRRRGGSGRRRGAEGGDDSEGVTVELNSDVALPYHWEQCLDIRVRRGIYRIYLGVSFLRARWVGCPPPWPPRLLGAARAGFPIIGP